MKRRSAAIGIVLLAIGWAISPAQALEIDIQVSPGTLYLESQGTWVTVHTDIAYGAVAGASVMLNGVEIEWSKSDNQGNFVAKFALDDVKGIVAPPSATLTLSGFSKEGIPFSGTDTVKVVAPRKKK